MTGIIALVQYSCAAYGAGGMSEIQPVTCLWVGIVDSGARAALSGINDTALVNMTDSIRLHCPVSSSYTAHRDTISGSKPQGR